MSNPEPPDDDFYITADCGHEVYEGDEIIEDNDSVRTQCVECFLDDIRKLTLSELADRFNATLRTVRE